MFRNVLTGHSEGTQQGITEIAKRILAKNTDIESIIECTKLTKEEIENLK